MNHTELSRGGLYGSRGSSYSDRCNKAGPNGWSGSGYDKWVERNSSPGHNSTLGKVQRQFWFTKSAVMRKFGKNQDEHVVASDAELDAKMELFKAIEASTRLLQVVLAEYQRKVCILAQEENSMGRLLKDWGRQDRGTASQVMTATGKSLSYTAQQRLALRAPLVRLFQEVDTFQTRAIEDTARTLRQMEKMRTEYRGALMWMKNISQDFNPDQYSQLEKFRQVQEIVRQKKAKFDCLKIKCIQKIDLLAASRCNMFSHALIVYQSAIILFSEKTAKTFNTVASNFAGYQHYNFQVIKELAEPEERREVETDDRSCAADEQMFFNADDHNQGEGDGEEDDPRQTLCKRHGKQRPATIESKSDSLLNLYYGSDQGSSAAGDEKMAAYSSESSDPAPATQMDLLSGEDILDSEKDIQQTLRELFDSPAHKPLKIVQQGPASAASLAQTQALDSSQGWDPNSTQSSQSFMPSHLLDYGLLDWQAAAANDRGDPAAGSHLGNTVCEASTDLTSQASSNAADGAGSKASHQDGGNARAASSGVTPGSRDVKLDWFRVFQDIDPLSGPNTDFFSKKENAGSC